MGNTTVSREEIELLRASANALIEDTAEPCWGLAQALAEMAEQLVSSSGLPAAYFGKGVKVLDPALAAFMPECCPACGEWTGQHDGWCIHAYEDQAEQPEPTEAAPSVDLGGMLTWLDLSGLPPVPPAEPPARKPTNWHFDAPDGGQVQGPNDYDLPF